MIIASIKKLYQKANTALQNPVVKSIVVVASIGLAIKAIALYKETIIAGTFGLNEVIDTFKMAMLVPVFIQSVFINSLKNLFIPNYIAELKHGGNKSNFQAIVFSITISISLLSILVAYIFTDVFLEIIYPQHTAAYFQLVKDNLFIVLPCLFFWGMTSVLTGLLEVENKFLISTIFELFPLLTMIIFLIYLKDVFGSMVLAYGTLVGSILGFAFVMFFNVKYKYFSIGKLILNDNSRLMIQQLPPKVSSGFLSAMNNSVDMFFAGQLVVGSLAALDYANRVPAFGVTIVIMALGNVLLPHFSRLVNEDLKKAYQYLFRILKWVFGIVLLGTIIGVFMSDWIVGIWLERGQFTNEDTIKVSAIQQILLVNVPFYLCTLIIVKFLTSINKNSFMAWVSLANLIINIILNIILIKYFGVFGLAMSTSLVFIISSCFYFSYTYKQYKKLA